MNEGFEFDFETVIDRVGQDAIAVEAVSDEPTGFAPMKPETGFDFLPMWVADMNFATAPDIMTHIIQRTQHPLFGYFSPKDEYYDGIIRWQSRRNGVTGLKPEHIGYENGVLGGLVSVLRAMGTPGDEVLLHSPTYVGFTGSIEAAGWRIVHSPLRRDEQGIWRMDFDDMERKLKERHIHLAVFCSPHNPCGRVWERWELEQAMALYQKYDVTVISDEIWSDIILAGHKHIPTQSVSEDARQRTVALYAPSKTFNLAGLVGSYHIIYNDSLRDRVRRASAATHYNSMNVLSMHALIGAYQDSGYRWLDELCRVLTANVQLAYNYFRALPGVTVSQPQGTYMLFVDFEGWCREHHLTMDQLLQAGWRVGIGWQDGRPFHGEWCIRINLALPTARVKEALDRMQKYVFC